jgi:hypothetical protein
LGPRYLNGWLAQAQQLPRAAGPVLAAWAVPTVSYSAVPTVLGVAHAGLAVSSLLQPIRGRLHPPGHSVVYLTERSDRLPIGHPAQWIGMSTRMLKE